MIEPGSPIHLGLFPTLEEDLRYSFPNATDEEIAQVIKDIERYDETVEKVKENLIKNGAIVIPIDTSQYRKWE
jgi:uncharacterized membrane protein